MKLKSKGRTSDNNNITIVPSMKVNPFEVHINRSKHYILGRKLKSDRGLPGVSRKKAVLKRKETLLQEYKLKAKSNQFIDQRIGETDKHMTEDDRIMSRFVAERMCLFKKKKFNLSDTEILTHKGQTLNEIERFEDTQSDDEDDNRRGSGALKGKFVENAHFGGGMLTKSKHDRESLIDELINESKKRKAERQRNKEVTLEATEELDKEWKTLGVIVTSTEYSGIFHNQERDKYDIVMCQLKLEPHAYPSQRLKTEEEIAKDDKEQLKRLKTERMKQLREIKVNKYGSHHREYDVDDWFTDFTVRLTENTHAPTDSDKESICKVVSDIQFEADSKISNMNEKLNIKCLSSSNTYETPQESAVLSKNRSSEENKVSSVAMNFEDSIEYKCLDEECSMDDLTELMPEITDSSSILTTNERSSIQSNNVKVIEEKEASNAEHTVELDFPFVLNVPDDHTSFRDFIVNRTTHQQNIIHEILVTSNYHSVNKKKMLKLARIIVELVKGGEITWESLIVFVSLFNVLKEFNNKECLKMAFNSLSVKVEGLVEDTLPVEGMKFLVWYILVFLQPQGMNVLIPVSKPALSLACSLVTRTQHVTLGLLCSYLLLQDAKISSMVYPEAIIFLYTCIQSSADAQQKSSEKENNNTELTDYLTKEDFKLHLDFDKTTTGENNILYCSITFLSDFVKVYKKYPQSKIMFRQAQHSVYSLDVNAYPPTLSKKISELQMLFKDLNSVHLPPLVKSTKRPKSLHQYEPSFNTVTVRKSLGGLTAEQQERQKLLHKYKHAMKGAVRELRRDRVFLANVKLEKKARSDRQRMKMVKEIFSLGAAQQQEFLKLKHNK